ncbi:MAG TPA: iron ABC transporter permease [Trueperaceae bacterium]|nr:iron ABC transporter permease [Trueperaceae bacterium]
MLVLSIVLLFVAALLATMVGTTAIPLDRLFESAGRVLRGEELVPVDVIVFGIRMPRVLLAAVVGASLGLSGAVFQGVFRNPLADPFLLGTASGAGLGSALVVAAPVASAMAGRFMQPLVAFVFALGTVVLVSLLARSGSSLPVVRLILAGVVVSSMLSAVTSFLMVAAREQAATILNRLLGGFGLASWPDVLVVTLFLVPAAVVALALARGLDVLQLGDRGAAYLGLPVEKVRFVLLAGATLTTAAAVSVAGIIGFVGLMTPHAVRLLVGPRHGPLVALSLVWGAVFMVVADLIARTLIAPVEVPVGVVTAVFGGPLFLALLRRGGG